MVIFTSPLSLEKARLIHIVLQLTNRLKLVVAEKFINKIQICYCITQSIQYLPILEYITDIRHKVECIINSTAMWHLATQAKLANNI